MTVVPSLPTTTRRAGVLTGDLVGSRAQPASRVAQAMTCLESATRDIARDTGQAALFERHRGDGWQVFLPEGAEALRAALRLVAALAARDADLATRIAIGIGDAQVPGNRDKGLSLGAASGAAFIAAGDTLDAMARGARLDIMPAVGAPLRAMVGLLDWQSQHWTAPQAEALFEALRRTPKTQDEIATGFGISRQAVQARLSGTGLGALRDAVIAFERHVGSLGDTPA